MNSYEIESFIVAVAWLIKYIICPDFVFYQQCHSSNRAVIFL